MILGGFAGLFEEDGVVFLRKVRWISFADRGTGVDHARTGKFTGAGVFTIVEEADGAGASKWGLLKSYRKKRDGWISLYYVTRI